MLRYEKYQQNLGEKIKIKRWLKAGEEEHLLLKPQEGFQHYVRQLHPFLNEIMSETLKK